MTSLWNRRRLIGALAALPAGVAALGQHPAMAADPIRVRMGVLNFDPATPGLYAKEAGLFSDAGLDVSVTVVPSGAAAAAAVVGGSIDIALSSMFSVLTAHVHGVPLVLVSGSMLFDKNDPATGGLVVKSSSPYQHPADLNGKVIGVAALASEMYVNVRSWIDKSGGKSETIQFIEVNGAGTGPALESGRIDAAGIGVPILGNLTSSKDFRSLGNPTQGIASRYLAAAWIATPDYAQKNPAVIRAFAGAIAKAVPYCLTHSNETAPMLAKYTGMDVASIVKNARSHYYAPLDPRDIQPAIDAAAKYQVIPKSFLARDIIVSA